MMRALLVMSLLLTGCAAQFMRQPCPPGHAYAVCNGMPYCAPAGIASCNGQGPVHQ
jgi:hypothetical protein